MSPTDMTQRNLAIPAIAFLPGALLVLGLHPWLQRLPLVLEYLTYVSLLGLVEYAASLLSARASQRYAWGTSAAVAEADHADILHACLWGLAALVFAYVVTPQLLAFGGFP